MSDFDYYMGAFVCNISWYVISLDNAVNGFFAMALFAMILLMLFSINKERSKDD